MRILLALDGSESSIHARDLAASLLWPGDTVIRVVAAYEVPIDWIDGVGAAIPWAGDAEDALREELDAELRRLASPLDGRGWRIDLRVVKGRPASAIVQEARDLEADLVVLGSRGRGPLASFILGSISAEVVDQSPCPVLVARQGRVARLLVATDGSDIASSIPDVLGAWGAFRGIAAEAVSVAPEPERAFEFVGEGTARGSDAITKGRSDLVDRYRHYAEELAARLREVGIPATAVALAGRPAHEIVGAAQRHGIDLIVTGTRGRHGAERLILGSVARTVLLHAPCSVLVVRGATPTP